ncbi:MAG: glycosyltransferase family 1 protein [Desulfobacteraceae bacterium]|nr:MAG: glycosyltransferase family 1 protein [Desulfobacteraceae bacterium]
MMKVLFILDDYLIKDRYGGGDIIARSIVSGLKKKGHTVKVACNGDENNIIDTEKEIFRILTPKYTWKKSLLYELSSNIVGDKRRLSELLSGFKPDIIYCLHLGGVAVPVISWLDKVGILKVYRIGYEWVRLHYYPKKSKCDNLKLQFAIFNSSDLLERHAQYLVPGSRWIMIPNGVDTSLFRHHKHCISRGELRLIFVGRIVPHKGLHILISAMRILKSNITEKKLCLTIIGTPAKKEYEALLRNRIKEEELQELIQWVGGVPHENIPKYLDRSDMLIFPSIKREGNRTVEGCPSVILESLAAGLPVVARITPGVDEIVEDKKTCIGVYHDDPQELAGRIRYLADNPSLYSKISESGTKIIDQKYGFDEMIRRTEDFLAGCAHK